ncbi:FH1/FH2 domain-containing protein 3 isoform X2 [Harmonia axyridis]|uniref:FH1/FH2 domain-containing protein 3 isoform X2 n=1 Tax=Harmonia axyridis TaxID=115357 RepID=UPI001E276AF1|nr:FH1/FH2 domain-containing protein 3 isoform X2 [Harmonia axyridis]
MSNYRNLAPWNKSTSAGNSKLTSPYKYESSGVGKTSGTDARSKLDDEKKSTPTLRIQAPKFGSSLYNAGHQRNTTSTSKDTGNYSNRSELPRFKPSLDRKESLHPPVSYRPFTKTTPRSRDPSPVDRSTTSSSTSYNRLAPPSVRRSVSRERTNSTSSIGSISTTTPRYGGRSSLNQDDLPSAKKYSGISKPDKYEDSTSKYKNIGRTTSREDLTGSSKYITSRFLPKNTIERSYSGYSRGSSSLAKANEASRKNRELLNVIQAQQERGRTSRSVSRCSSINFDDISQRSSRGSTSETPSSQKEVEMETINVVTRATSPTLSKPTSLLKPRRIEIAKTIEKQVLRPKHKPEMEDKAIQSDRLDDTTKNSKFAGASRITATSWNSMLDMKFSSPNKKITKSSSNSSESSGNEQSSPKKKESSPNSPGLPKSSSNKSVGHSCVPEEKSKSAGGKNERKLLPPQIPTRDSSAKSITNHLSSSNQNKDFRKSILNMSDLAKRKVGRRSNSVSSADSESENVKDSEATDISENLTSCRSFHNSTSLGSKLPQKLGSEKNLNNRSRRSPSSDLSLSLSSANASGNEEETKAKPVGETAPKEQNFRQNEGSSLSQSSNLDSAQAKSFLSRALAPVTNFFKAKQESEEKVKWEMSSSSEGNADSNSQHRKLQEASDVQVKTLRVPSMRHVPSGEIPWWLDENAEIPEGVKTYPNWVKEDGTTADGRVVYRLRKNESGNSSWWNDSSENSEARPAQKDKSPNLLCVQEHSDEYGKALFKIRRNDSTKSGWWLDSSENSSADPKNVDGEYLVQKDENGRISYRKKDPTDADGNTVYLQQQTDEHGKTMYKIRRNDSSKSSWWLDSSESSGPKKNQVLEGDYVIQKDEMGRVLYKIRKNDSMTSSWWNDSNENSNSGKLEGKEGQSQQTLDSEYLELHKIRHIDSGERAWWLSSQENIAEASQPDTEGVQSLIKIRHQDSGEPAWWLQNEEGGDPVPLGDRASPEGLEMPKDEGRLSPYDNVPESKVRPDTLFISKHTNIDDILGGASQMWSPLMERLFGYHGDSKNGGNVIGGDVNNGPGNMEGYDGAKVKYANTKLDDAALQLYKDGDYGSYLDLDASISEQQEEFEGFQSNKKNSIVLRTQLSVRVHTIIEKLLTSEGRELRRALFSLKQIFQEDKDLVHEFVQNDGLSCLIKVGSEADQNYQNYILRALGQVMLYVDGMNGVMDHNQTVQWLYSLISSKFRLVVKTALKLLLVFVEYTDSNCMLLVKAVQAVDCSQGLLPWHNVMKLLRDFDSADTELLIYATTLINKVLNGVPDQDTYYDQTDSLEEQGIEHIIQRYMSKPGTDLDLLQQFQIYEAVLQYEDGEETSGNPFRLLDESIRKTLRCRKSMVDSTERRKSRRHSTGTSNVYALNKKNSINNNNNNVGLCLQPQTNQEDDDDTSSSHSSEMGNPDPNLNGRYKDNNQAREAGVTPALRQRRERAERQRHFLKQQQETISMYRNKVQNVEDTNNDKVNGNYTNALQQRINNNGNILNRNSSRKDLTPLLNAVNKLDTEESLTKQPWILSMMYNKNSETQEGRENENDAENGNENERNLLMQLKRENTVKDLTQKLASQNILHSPSEENKINRMGDMSGLISKAKEGLAKSKSKVDVVKSPTSENVPKFEAKKSENELRWEEMVANMKRSLNLCDMDFTDLGSEDEVDILAPTQVSNGIPPPPPPLLKEHPVAPPPPPLSNRLGAPPFAPNPPPPVFSTNLQKPKNETKIPIKKNKKTVKLFWKEVRDDLVASNKLKSGHIWDELSPVSVDTQKLEHLFESRAKDLLTKEKQQELNKNKEIIVLDPKRSNAINIGMTKLPPPRSIKAAILKMDATIMNREGIEKLLTMLPTKDERTKIQEAQAANPDLPLGSAEQFLLTLASISELQARLKLWAFKLDFENTEREIAEPLMDLKQGIEVLRANKTFRGILSTLLSIGNFLNGAEVKGFQIEYLAKVPEVKDTVHKHSLLHHLCHIVMEKFPEATDLYSEIGAITRASKVDFDELTLSIQRLEDDCKASWDHLKVIAKHDGTTMIKGKMSDFLSDCAERIILLNIIHRRVMNRFHKFLLWLGIPVHQISDTKPNEFCKIISEFALEYRTTRERVLQQLEKKANHRERNKTRGKMITDVGKFKTKEDRADAELRQLLGSDLSDVESFQGTLPLRRTRRDGNRSFLGSTNGNLTDGDDEILESLVKTATKGPSRIAPRERKRTRHADRKSFFNSVKRSRTRENNPYSNQDSP